MISIWLKIWFGYHRISNAIPMVLPVEERRAGADADSKGRTTALSYITSKFGGLAGLQRAQSDDELKFTFLPLLHYNKSGRWYTSCVSTFWDTAGSSSSPCDIFVRQKWTKREKYRGPFIAA